MIKTMWRPWWIKAHSDSLRSAFYAVGLCQGRDKKFSVSALTQRYAAVHIGKCSQREGA